MIGGRGTRTRSALAVVAAVGAVGCGWFGDGAPREFDEVADDPVLAVDLAGAERGEVAGTSGMGEDTPFGGSPTRAQRTWSSAGDPVDLLVAGVEAVVAEEATVTEVFCNGRYSVRGTKRLDSGELADMTLRTRPGAPAELVITLSVGSGSPSGDVVVGSTSRDDGVRGDCPSGLVDRLRPYLGG